MDPSFLYIHDALVRCYVAKSMLGEALEESDKYAKVARPADGQVYRAYVMAAMGKSEECRKILDDLEANQQNESLSPYALAAVHFKLGEADKGFDWLEKAYDSYHRYVFLLAVAPDLDGHRDNPRYLALLEKTGLAKLVKG